MSDPLEKVLREAQGWEPPPSHVEDARRRGQRVKRARTAGFAALAVLAVAGVIASANVADNFLQPQEIIAVLKGDDPSPDAKAKAARFAFHAIFQAGPYELDYQGIERTDAGWRATFVSGPPVAELERRLQLHEATVEEFEEEYRLLQDRIAIAQRTEEDKKILRQLESDLERQEHNLPLAREDVRRAAKELKETTEAGGPHVTEIEVTQDEGVFRVASVTGPYDEDERAAIEDFEEEVPEAAFGYEFISITTVQDGGLGVRGEAIYVGPIPAEGQMRCGLELYDQEGSLVAATPQKRYWESDGEKLEERRDGIGMGGPLKLLAPGLPPDEELAPRTICTSVQPEIPSEPLTEEYSFEPWPGSQWYGPDGDEIPMEGRTIDAYTGHEHCDWQSSVLLQVGKRSGLHAGPNDPRVYVRDPEGIFTEQLLTSFDDNVAMPDVAQNTGYRTDFMELWLDPSDEKAAYLRFHDHAERWPLSDGSIGCD